jgi:ubiquinone biosynthesis protein Coq4
MNVKLMYEVAHAFLRGAPLGDVAVMKFAALRSSPRGLDERLGHLRAFAPRLTVASMRRLPEGSLGRENARFLEHNGLEHLTISDAMLERFADNPYAIRYTVTHDLHHLLTGFDTGVAGEVGVVGFTVGQGAGPISPTALRALRWIYPLMSPSQAGAIFHNLGLGTEMGRKAKLLLAEPLESWLDQPLDAVRERVGIRDDDRARIRPSGGSSLVRTIYDAAGRRSTARLRHKRSAPGSNHDSGTGG